MELVNITIEEFKEKLYNDYIRIFPEEEQREWKNIKRTYEQGIEKFYVIVEDENIVGFFMLEENKTYNSYYIDYFTILDKYRNKGFGTKAIKCLIKDIIKDDLLCIEIEKPIETNLDTIRRKNFYLKAGFKEVNSEYLLYKVLYRPFIYSKNNISKDLIDKIMFDYYIINCGKKAVEINCKIIK